MNNLPKALYIHIPFCESICDYCDFAKLQYFHSFAEKYLVALEKELLKRVNNRDIETIYIGGGTPTSLDDDQFERLLKMIKPFSKRIIEYTVEANPESLSLSKIMLLKKYGVNRVSIGVESTNNEVLKAINRKHTFKDVQKVVCLLKENGIDNVNLDLIIGLPHVSEELLMKDINNILSLKPQHISCYSLTVHKHTRFHLNGIVEPSEDYVYNAYKAINIMLKEKGYSHYEVSNWSKPGYESKHNLTYWNNEHYYGIGLAASGYIGNVRYKNTTNFNEYISLRNNIEEEIVSFEDQKQYYLMLKLRTKNGVDLDEYFKEFGEDLFKQKQTIIEEYISQGYLVKNDQNLSPTFDGMMILDTIVLHLI